MTLTTRTPERTCIGCRTKRPQAALVRVSVGPDGAAELDRHAGGRGAWLCNPPNPCLDLAKKRRGFARAFRQPVGERFLASLTAAITARDDDEADQG